MSNVDITDPNHHMAEAIPDGFVFEDEHPLLKIPFSAVIGDRKFEGDSLSLTQAMVSGLLPPTTEVYEELVTLRFDFDGFSINLFVEAFVSPSSETDNPVVSLRFAEPMGEHLAPLRFILNSFISGHVVNMGQLLGFTGPTVVKTKQAQEKPTTLRRVMNGLRMGLVFVAGVGLVYSATTIVYNRVAYRYEANPIALSRQGDVMRATTAGQITYVNPLAKEGEVAFSIASNSGDLLSTQMPCDCEIAALPGFAQGATVLAGDPVVKLLSDSAALVGSAQLSDGGVTRIIAGDTAEIETTSGAVLPVVLSFQETGLREGGQGVIANVTVPEAHASEVTENEVGRLRFRNRFAQVWLKPIADRISSITSGSK